VTDPRRLILYLSLLPAALPAAGPSEFFEMRVRPVLAKSCGGCHIAGSMGGFQMDTREHVLKGGKSGAALIAGDPDNSLLIQAVRQTNPKLKMPPGGKLKDNEIADLATWVKSGAVWGDAAVAMKAPGYVITPEQRAFWAFQPIKNPTPPAVKAKSPIDAFVLARLEAEHLRPAKPADKRVLIRRASFDLTGLPPAPEEVEAFVKDKSPDAFAKVVDRLLASPRYGERWGRYWLDVARYSDDKLDSERENAYPNSFRYRDWVIQALNDDMPYDTFVKAQIAGDLMPALDRTKMEPGLGFYALSPEFQDDRVDATTRGFLAMTVACAQCHDHKFDPIPTKDYYSLMGIFTSTELSEYPLADAAQVEAFKAKKKQIDDAKGAIDALIKTQSVALAEVLAANTAEYVRAVAGQKAAATLDQETLERWKKYLNRKDLEHPFFRDWQKQDAAKLQSLVVKVNEEKLKIDDENHIRLGLNPSRDNLANADLKSIDRDKFVLWRDLFGDRGILHYAGKDIDRFLAPIFKERLDAMRAEVAALEKALPPQYPFLQTIHDKAHPGNQRVHIRGSADNLGDEVPRHFMSILSKGDPEAYKTGSGRLELAEDIASPSNPLTARVIANRIWLHHFGQGIVRTPSNFGQLGDRPSHPELLDYLASRLIADGWSLKKLHREIMLSSTYQQSTEMIDANFAKDPDNRLLWRANRRRLDVEAMRDTFLADSGALNLTMGGVAKKLTDDNHRRTVYGFVSRRKLDGTLSLFDFPNPNATSEQRLDTNVPLQRLFYLNSAFVEQQSKLLSERLKTLPDDGARIDRAYGLLFGRPPSAEERKLGIEYLKTGTWPRYAQALYASNEFSFVE
jgi:mono/diheme cytochrome c family protein